MLTYREELAPFPCARRRPRSRPRSALGALPRYLALVRGAMRETAARPTNAPPLRTERGKGKKCRTLALNKYFQLSQTAGLFETQIACANGEIARTLFSGATSVEAVKPFGRGGRFSCYIIWYR